MSLGTVFVYKSCQRKKKSLINTKNDIRFKGRDINQKYPMKGNHNSDLNEVKQSDLEPLGPRTVKISDLMVS
jgi:hypothetical protein